MKIAVCDDNEIDTLNTVSLLTEYKKQNDEGMVISSFSNALDLLDALQHDDYDVVLLDVLMPTINGLEAAKEIRKTDNKIIIVLLTSSPEFAIEGYSVKAYSYLLKPCATQRLFALLDTLQETFKTRDEFVMVKARTGVTKIFFSQIVYTEVSGKTFTFHLSDNTVYEAFASMGKFETLLMTHKEFCRTHRSYIVNLHYVKELTSRNILCTNGVTIPVSRRVYNDVRIKYINQMFLENGD